MTLLTELGASRKAEGDERFEGLFDTHEFNRLDGWLIARKHDRRARMENLREFRGGGENRFFAGGQLPLSEGEFGLHALAVRFKPLPSAGILLGDACQVGGECLGFGGDRQSVLGADKF